MEWIIVGICAVVIYFAFKGRGQRPKKTLTLQQAKRINPIDEADLDGDSTHFPNDLLRDLGVLVYLGAAMEVAEDKKQAAFPSLWSAQYTRDAAVFKAGAMGALGERLCKKIGELPKDSNEDMGKNVLTAEVAAWVGSKVGLDMRRELLEALARKGAKL